MYRDLLNDGSDITPAGVYDLVTGSTGLAEEIRLSRSRVALAVAAGDDRAMLTWLGMLHALVRIERGAGEEESELAAMLAGVAESVRLADSG